MTDAFGRASNHEERHKEWQDEIDRRDEIINSDRQVIADLEADLASTREILAHTDMGSLPHRWTLAQIAETRISDMLVLRDQVSDTCARAEKAEKSLASALEALRPTRIRMKQELLDAADEWLEAIEAMTDDDDDKPIKLALRFLLDFYRRAAIVEGGEATSDI